MKSLVEIIKKPDGYMYATSHINIFVHIARLLKRPVYRVVL